MYGYGTATGDEMNGWDSIRDDNNSSGVDNVLLDDIEKMLMTEQEDDADVAGLEDLPFAEFPDDFFNDLLIDSADVADHGKESNSNSGSSSNEEKADDVAAVGDDPITKKHRRQLRNRDAAVRSRERKKMYVKDLEMKSRYLEGECRRLGILLQCCSAENQALRLSLHNSKAFDASMTKQESAVLVLESLLLGSLLWFLGIVCLFRPLPPPENVGDKVQESLVLPERSPNHDKALSFQMSQLFIMSRSCKGSRWRMKQVLLV